MIRGRKVGRPARRPDSRPGRLTAGTLLLVLSGPFGALASATPALAQTPEEEIRSLRARSNEAIARHDVEAVLSFLDDEYQITTGNGRLLQGSAGEEDAWAAEFARADDLRYVRTPESVEVSVSGGRAAEVGKWVGTWTTAEGATRVGGRYAAHWRKAPGEWKIRAELFVTLHCEGAGCP